MQDMLVRLYDLPDYSELRDELSRVGITCRNALAAEKSIVSDWVEEHFGKGWASEAEISFSYQPITCIIAVKDQEILGFACYDAAYRNFFGPTGVAEEHRGRGIGKVLLWLSLMGMRSQGYAYGIIGGVGPASFYEKVVGAEIISGSDPGIYKGILSKIPSEADGH